MAKATITSTTHYGSDHVSILSEPQVFYAMLGLSVGLGAGEIAAMPINVCFIVDCSTSMRGRPMDIMKRVLSRVGDWLGQDDYVSIVAFNDRAETILKPVKVAELENVNRLVARLHATGGTEIYQGLKRGYVQLIRTPGFKTTIPHLVLITDGRTYGDEDMCMRLVTSSNNESITFSAIGIGDEWNDEFLDELAGVSGGETRYVTAIDQLVVEVEALLLKVKKAKLPPCFFEYELQGGCQISQIFRLSPEVMPLRETNSVCQLGALQPGETIHLLFEFRIPPIHISQSNLNLLNGSLKINNVADILQGDAKRVEFKVPVMMGAAKTLPPSHAVMNAVYGVSIYRMQENARKLIQQGQVSEGVQILTNLARHLGAQGKNELAQKIHEETTFITKHHAYSQSGDKEIKYATKLLADQTQKVIINESTRKVSL